MKAVNWIWIIVISWTIFSILFFILEIIPLWMFLLFLMPIIITVFVFILLKFSMKKVIQKSSKYSLSKIFQDINNQLEDMPTKTRLEWDLREIRHQERKYKIDNKYVNYVSLFAPIQSTGAFVRIIYNLDEKKIVNIDGRVHRESFLKDPFDGFKPTAEYFQPPMQYPYYSRIHGHRRPVPRIGVGNNEFDTSYNDYHFSEVNKEEEEENEED